MYTVGITSNQLEGPGRTLSFADDVLAYRHGRERQDIADSTQEELNRISNWCQEYNGSIHPDKAAALWCSLNNHAVKANMPPVYIEGKKIQKVNTKTWESLLTEAFAERSTSTKTQSKLARD